MIHLLTMLNGIKIKIQIITNMLGSKVENVTIEEKLEKIKENLKSQ